MQKEQAYYKEQLLKFINNELEAGQVTSLMHFIHQNPEWYTWVMQEPQVTALLEQLAQGTTVPEAIAGRMRERLLKTIEKPSAPEEKGKGRRGILLTTRYIKRVGWAAAVFLVVLLTFVLLNKKNPPENKPQVAQTGQGILSGGNHAFLTLANGQKITLDSNYGNILQQGQLKVINLEGQLNYKGRSNAMEYHKLSTPRGGQYAVVLPDGTRVWLNAASSITYPTLFTGNERKVHITGEVYFEVFKNAARPFRVAITPLPGRDETEVEVLGTHFNINAYTDEAFIKTTLFEGKVKITNKQSITGNEQMIPGKFGPGNNEYVTLRPGQQAQIAQQQLQNAKAIRVVNDADLEQAIAWKNGLFNFDNADLKTVLRQLSRWYNVEVLFEGPIPERRFGGEIPMDLNLDEVLKAMSKMEVKFRVQGRKLIVLP